jgi:hypothetical protein
MRLESESIPGVAAARVKAPSRAHQFFGSVLTDFDQNVCAKPRVHLVLLCTFYPERLPYSVEALSERFCLTSFIGGKINWLTKRASQVTQSKTVYAYNLLVFLDPSESTVK